MKCNKCHKDFTDKDKRHTNYRQFMGDYFHMMCPGTSCWICKKEINYSDAKKDALGRWQHKACKVAVNPETQRKADEADEIALRDEMMEADPSSWIVKRR